MSDKKIATKGFLSISKPNKLFIRLSLILIIGIILLLNGITLVKQQSFKHKSQTDKLAIISHSFEDSNLLGSVILVKDGKTLFTHSYGYADKKNNVLNTPVTLYPVASLQKKMTAVIIAQLIRENKLTYDTTIDTFFTDLEYSEDITIRDLLDHTSGYAMPETPSRKVLSTEKEQLDNVLKTSFFVEHGEPYYSNGNYSLLASIISQIEGTSYKDALKKRIFVPLEMTSSYLWDDIPKNTLLPKEYSSINGLSYQTNHRIYSQELMSTLLGAGNVFSTVSDMAIFFSSLNNNSLLSQAEYDELFHFNEPIMTSGNISASGVSGGYSSYFYGDITNQTFVIFLANQPSNEYPDQLLTQVYQQLLLF